jgi:hypothetical protein
LASAFQLLSRALAELKAPVPHEALRLRMVALRGREDSLLEPDRFLRLLRQANDAEIADVRKLNENEYEVAPHRLDGTPTQAPPSAGPPPAALEPVASEPPRDIEAEVSVGPANGQRAGLRFRRGSRGSMRVAEIPLIGVVQDEATDAPQPAAEQPATKPARPRSRGRKRAAAARQEETDPTPPAPEEASPPAPRRRPPRPRARKKPE